MEQEAEEEGVTGLFDIKLFFPPLLECFTKKHKDFRAKHIVLKKNMQLVYFLRKHVLIT